MVIEDAANDHTGSYSATLLNVTAGPLSSNADPDGVYLLVGGDSISGSLAPAPDFDCFKFAGVVGDTVQITAVATSGPINTTTYIYPPTGPPVVVTTNDDITYVLAAAGTFAIVIQDSGLDETGTYNLTYEGPGNVSQTPEEEAFDRTRVVVQPPYPNPFVRTATLGFSLPRELPVRIAVFNAEGSLVRTIADRSLPAGRHRFEWDGRDDRGRRAASGTYYLSMRAGETSDRRKLIHVR